MLTAAGETYRIKIPGEILAPVNNELQSVTIKPLTVHSFQTIVKAVKEDHSLIPLLMVKESVLEPALDINQIRGMKVGLVNFLINEIKRISGIV